MERYIIPFPYKSRNYYVFIEKHPGLKSFSIVQLTPETDEVVDRQISVEEIKSFSEPLNPHSLNLHQTVIRCLASYLQERGWPIDEHSRS